ncbi:MAG: hypothetical protein VKL39_19260 [Leptolyngbyaceae bacterium]|nr:hypothetical protein [Leptolyngbyaceae bacterium]
MASLHRRAIGVFPDRLKTASALQALSDSGFSMSHVTIIARDPQREGDISGIEVKGEVSNQADTGGTVGAFAGGLLGGATGLLVGLGSITIPGVGPALLAGEAAVLLTTLIGGAAGVAVGGLLGALIGLGIPEHRAKRYRDRVADGNYLVMLKDSETEIARAERTLKSSGIEDWGVYDIPDNNHQSRREGTRDLSENKDNVRYIHPVHSESVYSKSSYVESSNVHRSGVDEPGPSTSQTLHRDHSSQIASLPHASNPVNASVNTVDKYDNPDTIDHHREHYSTDTSLATSEGVRIDSNGASADTDRSTEQRAIGVFQSQSRMEEALSQLKQTGFPLHTLSILVRESGSMLPSELRTHASHPLTGAANVMSGVNHLDLPHIGSTLVMGPDADSLMASLREGKLSNFVDMLEQLGLAKETANLYSRRLAEGAYLVTLKGQNQEVLKGASTLGKYGMSDWGIYNAHRQ